MDTREIYEALAEIRINKSIEAFRKGRVSKTSSPSVYYVWKKLREETWSRFDRVSGNLLLDIGCGLGDNVRQLCGRYVLCVGLDISKRHIGEARRFAREFGYLERSEFLVCDAERLPLRSSEFDGVICTEVIEHLRNPEALVAEAARVSRPGSIVVFSTVNGLVADLFSRTFGRLGAFIKSKMTIVDDEERLAAKYLMQLSIPEHLHEFKPAELKKLLGKYGLVIRRVSGGALPLVYITWLIDSRPFLWKALVRLDEIVDRLPFVRLLKYSIIVEALKAV